MTRLVDYPNPQRELQRRLAALGIDVTVRFDAAGDDTVDDGMAFLAPDGREYPVTLQLGMDATFGCNVIYFDENGEADEMEHGPIRRHLHDAAVAEIARKLRANPPRDPVPATPAP